MGAGSFHAERGDLAFVFLHPMAHSTDHNSQDWERVERRLSVLEERLADVSKEFSYIRDRLEEMHRFIVWRRIMGFVRFLLIVAPLILAAVYLPPLISQWLAPYQDLLKGGNVSPEEIFKQFPSVGI